METNHKVQCTPSLEYLCEPDMDAKTKEFVGFGPSSWVDYFVSSLEIKKAEIMFIIAHLKFDVINGEDRRNLIPAIKMVREALGCGLKEAKDFVDDADCDSGTSALMTAEKFGKLVALVGINFASNKETWVGLTVTPIKIVHDDHAPHEFL